MIRQTENHATVKALLRKGRANSDKQYPVRIRVSYKRERRYYPVIIDGKPLHMVETDFKKIMDTDVRKSEHQAIKKAIKTAESQANMARNTAEHGRPFSFDRFEKEYLNKESTKGMLGLFEGYLKDLLDEERIGSYESYSNAYRAFNRFRGGKSKTKEHEFVRGKEIRPEEFTVEVLKRFDLWLKNEGCNKTTTGIYARALRIIYNIAIDKNPSLAEHYPFSRRSNKSSKHSKGYRIKSGSGKKGQALSAPELQHFMATKPADGSPELEAKQYWMFMFYASGMNMADVAQLKYSNIQWDAIRYVRAKTRETEAKEELIEIPLIEPLKKILVAIGNHDKAPDSYVFPILGKNMTPLQIKAATKQKTKLINKWLKRLCESSELPVITTYWSRHSSASLLRDSGMSIEMISELLGHSDVKVTREYLTRFSTQKKQEAIEGAFASIMKAS